MEMVKQDNRRQLRSKVKELEREIIELREALSNKQEQESAMLQVLMRVEQDQRVTEDACQFAEQDAAVERYAAQMLQNHLEEGCWSFGTSCHGLDESETTESDDEFQICEICESEMLMHSACLVPPVTCPVPADWSFLPCKEKTKEYLQQRRVYLAQKEERYNKANERKSQILDVVRNLDLPCSSLDDIIDQLGGPDKVAEITGRRHRLIRASNGNAVSYKPRNSDGVSMEMVNMYE